MEILPFNRAASNRTASNRAAFFDLDLTLIRKDSFKTFVAWFYLNRSGSFKWLPALAVKAMLRKLGIISHAAFVQGMLAGMTGMDQGQIQALGDLFFASCLRQLLRPKALDQIARHRAAGDKVFILTGAPDIYVSAVCRFLGLDGYACTRLDLSQGRFSGQISGPVCLGMEKGRQVRALAHDHVLDLHGSYAYSDHESDLPLFVRVGQRVAVTPSPSLAQIARARGWPICIW